MTDHLKNFCTPPFPPLTDRDKKLLADTKNIPVAFEEQTLNCYVVGEGKTIILAHGWGSRASHLALIGKALVNSGFKVVLFDAPAHSSNKVPELTKTSSMFEYCRALNTIARNFGPIYGIVGHSIGAISSVLTSTGYKIMADYKISPEKLVLLSLPISMDILLQAFGKQHNLNNKEYEELKQDLEKEFNFTTGDYSVNYALKGSDLDILLIHDEDDDQIPFENISKLHKDFPGTDLFITKGYGHDKILLNRKMIFKVIEFLRK